MRNLIARLFLLLTVLIFTVHLSAQNAASITGVVSDDSGAVVPGVIVTLVNTATEATYKTESNAVGSYTLNQVKPGPGYKITFSHEGFKPTVITDIYLNVSTTRTQNAHLTIGAASQTVQVSAVNDSVTLNTTDATIGNNFDVTMVNELPIQTRDSPAALFGLQPGIANDAVTGARTDQSNVTLDGLDVNDFATGQTFAIIGRAPVDSIQEFRGEVAGDLSSTGTGSGGQFQLVTKSGTNHFHGNLNEYHRDTSTVANSWFNNAVGLPRTPLIRNQFGGNIGGPILKDKLFFFFDYNNSRIIQSSDVSRTVPLDAFRNGTVSYILNKDSNGITCTGASRQNTTPQCIGAATAAQVAGLDPQHKGFNSDLLTFINGRFPQANDPTRGDGVNSGGYRFTTPTPRYLYNYIGKVDYSLNSTMKIYGRFSIARQDSTQTVIQFKGDPMTHPFQDRSYSYVFGHTWTIGSTKLNKFAYGDTIAKYNFATTYDPAGTTVFTYGGSTQGTLSSSPYSSPSSQKRRVPIPEITDEFTWVKGNHNLAFGGTFKFIKTNSNLVNDFNFTTVGLGGNTLALKTSLRPNNIRTAGTTSSFDWDNDFALALGRIGAISSNYNYTNKGEVIKQGTGETRRYRYYETELYAGDTWKINPQLTLTYGVRYQLYSVPYETQGNESVQNLDFNTYFADRLKQSANGISGDSSLPFLVYQLGGKENNGPGQYNSSYKDFAPRFSFAYNPSFYKKLVVKGGAGIMFDRTVINAVNFIQDQSSYLFQNNANAQYGVSSDPSGSLLNDPRLGANNAIPAPPTAPAISSPYTPFVSGGTPNGLAGNQFNTAIDPFLKDPYSIVLNLGVEQELPNHFLLKVNYVGRLGRRLLAQADASQVVDFPDAVSGQQFSTAFGNMTKGVRAGADTTDMPAEPWMENVVAPGLGEYYGYPNNTSFLADNLTTMISNGDFADFNQALASNGLIDSNVGMASQLASNTFITNKGSSNFHGLLVTVNKNLSQGLKFDFNYTWSHSIDNVSAEANFIAASNGYGFLCDARNNRICRGNSDFDTKHVISSDFVYDLPFGRGRAYGATAPRWLDLGVGGWSISGLPTWQSGTALSTVSNAYVAGYANNAPAIFNGKKHDVAPHIVKNSDGSVYLYKDPTAAAADFVGPIGFQIGSRNNLRGPNAFGMDAGVAKTFPLYEDKVDLKFRTDAFNVFNHPVFDMPSTDITKPSSFGQITSTASTARVLQLSLRLEF